MLRKYITRLAIETGGKCSGIKDFNMEFELEFNHEDVIRRVMSFVASDHAYERIGSGRLNSFVEFLLEDWGDYCIESATSFDACGLLDPIVGTFEGAAI